MRSKPLYLLFLPFVLTSCEKSRSCYQCLLGNMVFAHLEMNYAAISSKKIVWNQNKTEMDYYANIYVASSQAELNTFYQETPFLSNPENENRILPEGSMEMIFFAQIPAGYAPFKRNNIPYQEESGDIVMVTDNFYFYQSHPQIIYSFIDLKIDSSVKEPSVFSYYYLISDTYKVQMKPENVRVLFSVGEKTNQSAS